MHDAGLAEALHRLCARFGIAADYHDVFGVRHEVPAAGLAALLRAAGVALPEDAGDLRQAFADAESAAESAHWREVLPPVQVLAEGAAAFGIALRLPAEVARIGWRVAEEGGALHQGELQTAALEAMAEREIDGVLHCLYRLEIPLALPTGYHRLSLAGQPGETLLVCAPARCHWPAALEDGGRLWGFTLQLHALRSPRNWGIGDFGDLAAFAAEAARRGAGVIGLNPLHALFPHRPAHASPYSPSSRAQLNVLYIDVEAVPDFLDCAPARERVRAPAFQARLAALREAPLVDHAGVAAAKHEVLERLHRHFLCRRPDDPEAVAFERFRGEGGEALHRHALFEALQAQAVQDDPGAWGWPAWPEAWRDPAGEAVAAWAHAHAERVGYFEYLQWQAARQLEAAERRCVALGMPIGLYLDLAVSVDRGGSDAWRHRDCFAPGVRVGAPPDAFNPNGQDWGLPPLRPDRLRASGHAAFIEALRANMRSAGAIRIDHAMMLMRLFWIPAGGTPREGAYVHYPMEELFAILALESRRHRCLVIGEDLGTVPDEVRAAMQRSGVLSYRLLYFEREADGRFRAPAAYPRDAVVAVSTHDLATLAGWWSVHDLRLRFALGLFPGPEVFERQLLDRAQERAWLLEALHAHAALPAESLAAAAGGALDAQAVAAVHGYLAAAPSCIAMVQLEDALGEREQANMPGTTDAQPNWRRKYAREVAALWGDDGVRTLAAAMARSRPRAAPATDAAAAPQARVPRATYRLQLHGGFGFDDAARILPYLVRLGISHVYCSPIQRARPGSLHGYDVVAHGEINPELGGMPAFERFVAALKAQGMGQLIDLVPNHMGVVGADNAWWTDVLENGAASPYADHFDIDWQPLTPGLAGKVLVPVLGDAYGRVLDRGELQLAWNDAHGSFAVAYHAHRFPLAPQAYPMVLARALAFVDDEAQAAELAGIAAAFGHLPLGCGPGTPAMAERVRDTALQKGRLAQLAARAPGVARAIGRALQAFNAPAGIDALHVLLEAQAYRLAYWRVAADEINYRRFFDVNDLAALSTEHEEVFEASHAFVLGLAARGWVDGLRIDHPDGLFDPAQYFERLQQGFVRRGGSPGALDAEDAQGRPHRPLYVVAEKIAAPHEDVPVSWALHGTTGYRFANLANALLVDPRGAARLRRGWHAFTGLRQDFAEVVRDARRDVARSTLASELERLAVALLGIAKRGRSTRDHSLNTLRDVLAEVAASFTVYRTYNGATASAQDERFVDEAVAAARVRLQLPDEGVFGFVREALLGRVPEDADAGTRCSALRFARRFQQFSAPVAAKGVEDTAFYRYFPLSALNEVGGDPDAIGVTPEQFHEASLDRRRRWPHTMLATSTHDNKRSEDVRLRIDVLSELPGPWRLALGRWRRLNAGLRVGPHAAPSAAHEYLLYQTLLGTLDAGPEADAAQPEAYVERIVRYMQKAAREGKTWTRWTGPDTAYEAALEAFVRGALALRPGNEFLAGLRQFARLLERHGAHNGLSLALLKYCSPGVPDIYQGCELIDRSLVDPDNRRPVDYVLRARRLAQLEALEGSEPQALEAAVHRLACAPESGQAKLWLIRRLLALRRAAPALLRDGSYEPLAVRGPRAGHVLAFARRHQGQCLVAIVPRLFAVLERAGAGSPPLGPRAWDGTEVMLPPGFAQAGFEDRVTGARHRVEGGAIGLAQVLRSFPGAVLLASADGDAQV